MSKNESQFNSSQGRYALALDLESVLVPEIWVAVARSLEIPSLALTTREVSNYAELMRHRIQLCREHHLTLGKLRTIVESLEPFAGAIDFLSWAVSRAEIYIISDTFIELALPLVEKLGNYQFFCHALQVDTDGYINRYQIEYSTPKAERVRQLRNKGFHVTAIGDSFNDLPMLEEADVAFLFNPSSSLPRSAVNIPATCTFIELKTQLEQIWKIPTTYLNNPLPTEIPKVASYC